MTTAPFDKALLHSHLGIYPTDPSLWQASVKTRSHLVRFPTNEQCAASKRQIIIVAFMNR